MKEAATTSSMFSGENERGAGGKFKNPTSRKPRSTPYDRPSSLAASVEPLNESPACRRKGRGWISKIIDPARRLISGGATRMFPSYFTQHPKSDIPAPLDSEDHGLGQDVSMDDLTVIENFGTPTSSSLATPVEGSDGPKHAYEIHVHDENQEQSLCSDDFLCEIEQILKAKTFSRDESRRLAGIVQSRASDISDDNKGKKIARMGVRTQSEGFVRSQVTPRMYFKENQKDLIDAKLYDICDSPIDLAKSYMWGNQTPQGGIGSKSTISKDDRASVHYNESALKPFGLPPQPNKSPMCWPGAVVSDQGGCFIPRSQSARLGLHNFPRTPYSRPIYSNTRTKLPESQPNRSSFNESTSNGAAFPLFRTPKNETRSLQSQPSGSYYESPSDGMAFPLFRTSTNEMMQSKDDAVYGSIGPIRRKTHDSLFGTPKRSVSDISSRNDPSSQIRISNNSGASLSLHKNKSESGSPSGTSRFHSVDNNASTSEAGILARRISKRIDKNILPTPKENSAMLNQEPQNSLSNARRYETTGNTLASDDSDFKSPFGSQSNNASEMTVLGQDNTKQKGKSQVRPLHSQGNGQFHNEHTNCKPTSSSSQAKHGLGSISIRKTNLKTPGYDTDEGFNFSFPFSSLGSEPPTPSLKPPSPSLKPLTQSVMPSSLAAGSCKPEVKFATPYKLDAKKSSQSLIFSFPDAKSDAFDPNLSAQINQEPRISLSNVIRNEMTGKSLASGDSDLKSAFGSQSNCASELTVSGENNTKQEDESQASPHRSQRNGDFHNESPNHKPPSRSSRAKHGLGSSSIRKTDLKPPTYDVGEGFSFSYPVSCLGSEPPPPFVEPMVPSLEPPSLAAGSRGEDVGLETSYKFGAEKSAQPLIFSFPGAKSDASDLVFKFGSNNEKRSSSNLPNNDVCF